MEEPGLSVVRIPRTVASGREELLGSRQQAWKVCELSVGLQNPRPRKQQDGAALDLFLRQQAQPAFHLHPLLLLECPEKVRFHQARRTRHLSCCKCMPDRLLDQSLRRIPRTRTPVQHGKLLGAAVLLQALLQQRLEQVVEAIPPLVLVKGDKQRVRAL